MTDTVVFLESWAVATWHMLVDSAAYLLAGLALAAFIRLLLHERNYDRLLGRRRAGQVLRAALFGIPLPLCSCSVLPVAHQLRRAGVTKGAAAAFLVSTPESGVDSILLTYSLTDPVMTIARPAAAFLAASVAGLGEVLWPSTEEGEVPTPGSSQPCPACATGSDEGRTWWLADKWRHLRCAFDDLVGELARYLLVGYLLAGLVVVLLGTDALGVPEWLRTGWGSYMGALLIGFPLYTCATSSTPFAAALLAAGFSPGAVLVFLLVGPATNIVSLVTVKKILGLIGSARYLVSIIVSAIVAGLVVDTLYGWIELPRWRSTQVPYEVSSWFEIAAAVIVGLLIVWYTTRYYVARLRAVFS